MNKFKPETTQVPLSFDQRTEKKRERKGMSVQLTVLLQCLLLPAFVVESTFVDDCYNHAGQFVGASCFVIYEQIDNYSSSKTKCTQLQNTYGHLAFIRSQEQATELFATGMVFNSQWYKLGNEKINGTWWFVDGNGFVQGRANLSLFSNSSSSSASADFLIGGGSSTIEIGDQSAWSLCEYEQHSFRSCVANSTAALVFNDWCFYWLQGTSTFAYEDAMDMCQPNGHLAVLVTKELFVAVEAMMTAASLSQAWIGIQQDPSATTKKDKWYWKILLPSINGTAYDYQPLDWNQVSWFPGEPDDWYYILSPNENGYENYGMLKRNNGGLSDVALYDYSSNAVICQYKAPARKFTLHNIAGYYNGSEFLVKQMVLTKIGLCTTSCSVSEFCLSFSYNSLTKDCRLNTVTPYSAVAANAFISDSDYELRYRVAVGRWY